MHLDRSGIIWGALRPRSIKSPHPLLRLRDIRCAQNGAASPCGTAPPSTQTSKLGKLGWERPRHVSLLSELPCACAHLFYRNCFDTSNAPSPVFPLMTQKWKTTLKAVESKAARELSLFEIKKKKNLSKLQVQSKWDKIELLKHDTDKLLEMFFFFPNQCSPADKDILIKVRWCK